MKKGSRWLVFALMLVLIFGMVTVSAFASDGEDAPRFVRRTSVHAGIPGGRKDDASSAPRFVTVRAVFRCAPGKPGSFPSAVRPPRGRHPDSRIRSPPSLSRSHRASALITSRL